eukprot:Pgem_evm1s15925
MSFQNLLHIAVVATCCLINVHGCNPNVKVELFDTQGVRGRPALSWEGEVSESHCETLKDDHVLRGKNGNEGLRFAKFESRETREFIFVCSQTDQQKLVLTGDYYNGNKWQYDKEFEIIGTNPFTESVSLSAFFGHRYNLK